MERLCKLNASATAKQLSDDNTGNTVSSQRNIHCSWILESKQRSIVVARTSIEQLIHLDHFSLVYLSLGVWWRVRWWQSDWPVRPVTQRGSCKPLTQTQSSGAWQHNSYATSSVIPQWQKYHVVQINTLYLARLNRKHDWHKIYISVRFNRQIYWKLTPLWRSHSLWDKINLESDRDRRIGIYATKRVNMFIIKCT